MNLDVGAQLEIILEFLSRNLLTFLNFYLFFNIFLLDYIIFFHLFSLGFRYGLNFMFLDRD